MAYYLDSTFDSFTSYQPNSFDDQSNILVGSDSFDLDNTIFSDPGPIPGRTTGPSASSNYTHFPEPLQTLPQPPLHSNPLGQSTNSNFALYDPDSPFNSPYPVKSLTKDGRLKTRLMGVGSDGGFLTSPLIVGKPRMDSRTGRAGPPEIAIDSPAPATPQAPLMTPGDSYHGSERTARAATSEMMPSLSTGSTASYPDGSSASMSISSSRAPPTPRMQEMTGLGMGISGVDDLQSALEHGDYGNPNLKIFGMPKNADLAAAANGKGNGSELGYLPYPEHMPTTTLGRGRNGLRDVGSGVVDESGGSVPQPPPTANRFVEHRFNRSHYPSQGPPPPSSQRTTRALPARTINKAKSCSNLGASAREQQRQMHQHPYEPMTPAQHQSSNFLAAGLPSAPFNSPHHNIPDGVSTDTSNAMPFSFADLYNLGLADESTMDDGEGGKKSPYEFAEELLAVEPNVHGAAGLGVGIGLGMGVTGEQDLAMLHSMPSNFGNASALSSPSTPYLSDTSPNMNGLAYHSNDELRSSAMYALSSIESTFSNASTLPPMPSSNSRPRCVTYAGMPPSNAHYSHGGGEDLVDPSLVSPQHQHQQLPRQRVASSAAAYGGNKNFSYPNRFAQQPMQQQQQREAPPMQWSGSQNAPPMPPMPSTPSHARMQAHPRSVTGPPRAEYGGDYNSNPNIFVSPDSQSHGAYDRNLAQFDALYEQYEEDQQPGGLPTPTKRSRAEDGDENEHDGGESVHSPDAQSPGGIGTRAKRLRTVASAPCLPARRLRPGPKPKNTKSPQQQHESVFSATLSPPIPQIRRASSPYASPLLTDGEEDDEDEGRFPDRDQNGNLITPATITYTPGPPALPGLPRSAVPKEVIQSLYAGIASHTAANGVKVPKRYVCLIEGCERTFPRKSAIESHIQTHLEDKPFVCPHDDCDASFVRQHDLRRHERIHSGNKPFPCPCGKGFARGDALARHRARGICSGSIVPRRI